MFFRKFPRFQGIVVQVHQLYAPRCGKMRIVAWRLFVCLVLRDGLKRANIRNSDKLHLQAKATQFRRLSQRFELLLQVVQLAHQNLQ